MARIWRLNLNSAVEGANLNKEPIFEGNPTAPQFTIWDRRFLSALLCFRFQLFKPSLPIPTAESRLNRLSPPHVSAFIIRRKAARRFLR
jgi:hypothetical protein